MFAVIILGTILFVLIVLYYQISVNPNFFKKKSKPPKPVKKDPDKRIGELDYKMSDLEYKNSIKTQQQFNKQENVQEVVSQEIQTKSDNITNAEDSEQIVFEDFENQFDKYVENDGNNNFDQEFDDDFNVFGDDNLADNINELPQSLKVLMITNLLNRVEW